MKQSEVKFRVWDKREEKMIYEEDCEGEDSKYKIGITLSGAAGDLREDDWYGGWIEESEDYVLMQYTGLKDKNGKRIYEKDIVKGRFVLDDVEDYLYLSLTEKEKKEQAKLFMVEDIFYLYTNPTPDDLEVIGNIYQDNNLLEQ